MDDLSRQQRRRIEREERSAWERTYRQRERWTGNYLGADDLLPYFASVKMADVIRDAVDNCLVQMLGTAPIPDKGFAVGVRVGYSPDDGNLIFAPAGPRQCRPDHNSHIAVLGFLDDGDVDSLELRSTIHDDPQVWMTAFVNAARTELRLPFAIVRDPNLVRKPYGNCWLYQIRFNTDQAVKEGKLCEQTLDKLGRGYFGVTRRPFALRMCEHQDDMKSGAGHLLHNVWRDLEMRNIPHRVIAQLAAHSTDEDDIYAMEERVVAQHTLAPLGLNMIPGGRSGISFLRSLGVHNAAFDNRDRLLVDAMRDRGFSRPHYRSAHLREYRQGAFTMVTGHWVNAKKLETTA